MDEFERLLAAGPGAGAAGLSPLGPSSGSSMFLTGGSGLGGAPAPARKPVRPMMWSGGLLSDIGDALSLPQVLMMQYLTHSRVSPWGERIAPSDYLNEHAWGKNTNPILRFAGNLAADVLADPLNLLAAPVKAAEEGGKALSLGAAALEGLGHVYEKVGKLRPIEEVALKLATNPIVRYLDGMGLGVTRVGREAHSATSALRARAAEIGNDVERGYSQFLKNHELTPEMDAWVSRLTDAAWDLQHDYAQALIRGDDPGMTVQELGTAIQKRRKALLSTPEFADTGLRPKEVMAAAKPFWEQDRRLSSLLVDAGVFGTGDVAQEVADVWGHGGHLKRIYAFVKRPELLERLLEDIPESEIAYFSDVLQAKAKREAGGLLDDGLRVDDLDSAHSAAESSSLLDDGRNLDNPAYWRAKARAVYESMARSMSSAWRDEAVQRAANGEQLVGGIPNIWEDREKLGPLGMRIMGVIHSAKTRGAFQARETAQAAEFMELYRSLAEGGLVHDSYDAAVKAGVLPERVAQIPEHNTFGAVSGRFADVAVRNDVVHWTKPLPEAVDMVRPVVGRWKALATVANPATNAANIIGNMMLAHVSGDLPPWRLGDYWEAFKELRAGDGVYLREYPGELRRNFVSAELGIGKGEDLGERTLRGIQGGPKGYKRFVDALDKTLEWTGDKYDFSESLFKLGVFVSARRRGMDVDAASQLAEKALFNYEDVPRVVEILRKSGVAPFVTFPLKALPLMAQAMVEQPARLAIYARKLPHNIEAVDPDAEKKKAAENPPPHVRGGFCVRLPGAPAGQGRYVNLTRPLPWASVERVTPEPGEEPGQGAFNSLLQQLGPAPRYLIEQGTGRRLFGPPVAKEGTVAHTLDTFLPGMVPGGRISRNLVEAGASPETSKYTFGEAVQSALLGFNPYDVEQRARRHRELIEARKHSIR